MAKVCAPTVGYENVGRDADVARRSVRNFTPSWFAVNMGTGIVSILLHTLPYDGRWLYWLSVVVFCVNTALFVFFNVVSFLRYALYPQIWAVMIRHPTQSLFLGAYSMGFSKWNRVSPRMDSH